MRRAAAWWSFWSAVLLIGYTTVGFPLLVAVRGLLRPRPYRRDESTPRVSVIIAAFNEEAIITRKLDNTLALDYPRSQIEIIVASDGSFDRTNELVSGYDSPEVRLLALPRQGKNDALNAAVAAATGEILIFTDADVILAPDALRYLVAPFADQEVGGVDGEQKPVRRVQPEREGRLWRFKRWLRLMESQSGTLPSAAGGLFAIRRSLFRPIPRRVGDDSFVALQVPAAHYRIVFEPRAAWYELASMPGAQTIFQRRVRWTTAWLATQWTMRRLYNPFDYGFFSLQLFSHKLLRRLLFGPLVVLTISAGLLWRGGTIYRLAFLSQIGLHAAGLLGHLAGKTRLGSVRLLRAPLAFERNNLVVLIALARFVRGQRADLWTPPRGQVPSASGAVAERGDAVTGPVEQSPLPASARQANVGVAGAPPSDD